MIILGIDPGYAILGYGVLEADGRKVRPLDYGVVETKVGTPFPERLDMLYAGVNELLRLYKPDCAVFEELFFYHNATTAIQVGAGRGVAMLAAQQGKAESSDGCCVTHIVLWCSLYDGDVSLYALILAVTMLENF